MERFSPCVLAETAIFYKIKDLLADHIEPFVHPVVVEPGVKMVVRGLAKAFKIPADGAQGEGRFSVPFDQFRCLRLGDDSDPRCLFFFKNRVRHPAKIAHDRPGEQSDQPRPIFYQNHRRALLERASVVNNGGNIVFRMIFEPAIDGPRADDIGENMDPAVLAQLLFFVKKVEVFACFRLFSPSICEKCSQE